MKLNPASAISLVAITALCLTALVSGNPGATASDREAAKQFGGAICKDYWADHCGFSCQGQVHLPNCQNSCCTALSGFSSVQVCGTYYDKGTSNGASACGGTCGQITTGVTAGCGT
jgi:hypothetical protein